MPNSLKSHYLKLTETAVIARDPAQAEAVVVLSHMERDILRTTSLFGGGKTLYGLYLWGQPGRGKSMLMDLFYEHIPYPSKRRIHFHAFMAEVHRRVKQWREGDAATRKKVFGTHKGDDPIPPIARLIAKESRLLCFDELQVTDIADAMILGRLFEALFAQKVILIATSNRAPEDLYKDGLNRDRFLPFIQLIRNQMVVHEIRGPKDFRLDRLKGAKVYFTPSDDPAQSEAFDSLWARLTEGMKETGTVVSVNQRELSFKRAAGPLLRTNFKHLCGKANGAADYLAIAERFTTIFIENIPQMGPENRNEAKRFVTLIDALYEAGVKLVSLAAAEPEKLYPTGDGAFEFERTVSRLEEMRSATYLEKAI
ncbi:MAG: cell division protein ZapE [Asticcacaulis sp.]